MQTLSQEEKLKQLKDARSNCKRDKYPNDYSSVDRLNVQINAIQYLIKPWHP